MMKQNKPTLFLLTSPSGSGKDYICDILETQHNIPIIRSYATRSPRTPDENGYTFINFKDINKMAQEMFQCFFNTETRDVYFTTKELLTKTFGDSQFATLIVTPQSVIPVRKALRDDYRIVYIHINTPENERIENMKSRGDSKEAIQSRISTMDLEIQEHYKQYMTDEEENLVEIHELDFLHFCCKNSDEALDIALRTIGIVSV